MEWSVNTDQLVYISILVHFNTGTCVHSYITKMNSLGYIWITTWYFPNSLPLFVHSTFMYFELTLTGE